MAAMNADYVKDGLIFWLDGLVHGEASWTDVIGGVTYTPRNNVSYEWRNGLHFTNPTAMEYFASTSPLVTNAVTIECAFTSDREQTAVIAVCARDENNQGKIAIYSDGTFGFPAIGGDNGQTYNLPVGTKYIAKSGANGFANGESASASSYTHSFTAYHYNVLGVQSNDLYKYPFGGTIHAIRMYNRVLSASEIARNYALDVIRYGL